MITFDREQFLNYVNFPFRFRGHLHDYVGNTILTTIEFSPSLLEDEVQLIFMLSGILKKYQFSDTDISRIKHWITENKIHV